MQKKDCYQRLDAYLSEIANELNRFLKVDLDEIDSAIFLELGTEMRTNLYYCFESFGAFLSEHFRDGAASSKEMRKVILHFRRRWEEINDLYEQIEHKMTGGNEGVHLTCGCRLAPLNEHWPLVENNFLQDILRTDKYRVLEREGGGKDVHPPGRTFQRKPKVLIFTTKIGGGNQMVTKAIAAAIKDRYHVSISNSNSELEENVWNEMARGGWWRLMGCLMKCFELTYDTVLKKFEGKVKERIERDHPDIVVSCCPAITAACYKVAVDNRIPVLGIATDYDAGHLVNAIQKKTEFLTIGIPVNDQAIKASIIPIVGQENIEVIGYPAHKAFRLRNEEEISFLRKKYQIPESGRVMTMMMGSLGCGRMIEQSADALMEAPVGLKNPFQELHVFALCGSNQDLCQRLMDKYGQVRSRVIIHPIPLISQAEVAEYYAISELLYTKAGGSTVTEAGLMGLPMLIDDSSHETNTLFWEKANIHFAVTRQLGEVLTDHREFTAKVYEWLNSPRKRTLLELPSFTDNLHRVLNMLLHKK